MPTVAIAGGTSPGLGRAITLATLSTSPTWTPLILSRSSTRPLWLRAIDPDGTRVAVVPVDYTSASSLTSALQGVHTLISVALAKDGSQAAMQIALARAAAEAGVRRFAPSEWADGPKGVEEVRMLKMLRAGVWETCDELERTHGMNWARFSVGGFMNYLGIGRYDADEKRICEEEMLERLRAGGGYAAGDDEICAGVDKEGDMPDGKGGFLYSLQTGLAEMLVKEDGSPVRIAMTEFRDIGRFVAASLNLPDWPRDMAMCGDVVTTAELLELVEQVTGKSFKVEKLPPSKIQKQIDSLQEHEFLKGLWLDLKLMYAKDEPFEGLLNGTVNKLCPEVEPMTVRQYLKKYCN